MYTYLPTPAQRQSCLETTSISPSPHHIDTSPQNLCNLASTPTSPLELLLPGLEDIFCEIQWTIFRLSCLISLWTTPSFLKLSSCVTSVTQHLVIFLKSVLNLSSDSSQVLFPLLIFSILAGYFQAFHLCCPLLLPLHVLLMNKY